MDQELARAVFARWEEGLPVYEGTFYKAAEALNMDPDAALAEARFFTKLDQYLLEKRAMTFHEKAYFAIAAGVDPLGIVKTASAHYLQPEEIILVTLRDRNFVPDLEKLAFMGMQGGPTEGPAMGGGSPTPAQGGPGGGDFATAPTEPQPGQQVQQQPQARTPYQAGPTAPQQVPPSEGGNLQELLQGAQQADAAPMGGQDGLPPSGMGAQQTPPPPTAEEKLQQAFGNQLDPDTLARYAPQLDEFENQIGMTIQDPKQIEKFVKELQKGEKKMVDEAIKQYGEQKAQEQAQASGMGGPGGGMMGGASTASFDPTAPKPKKPGGAPPAAAGGAPEPAPGQEDPGQAAMAKLSFAVRRLAQVSGNFGRP